MAALDPGRNPGTGKKENQSGIPEKRNRLLRLYETGPVHPDQKPKQQSRTKHSARISEGYVQKWHLHLSDNRPDNRRNPDLNETGEGTAWCKIG